jgi:transcription elongation factor GreB
MGRYRAPLPRSSPYITRAGYERLSAELKDLWVRREVVTEHLAAAAAEGDRSENAEYIYRKKELAGLDRRIRYLQKRLPDLKVVDRRADSSQVFFGACVDLEKDNGDQITINIVGADEINPSLNRVSIDSPLAQALLKKTIDEEVEIEVEGKRLSYCVISISYP